jgi:hypothetical protein
MSYEIPQSRGRRGWLRTSLLAVGFLLVAQIGVAQSQSTSRTTEESTEPLVAAVSGVRANVVEGEVVFQGTEAKFSLSTGLELEQGDWIRSSQRSRAELLLQPGNYLRLGEETECRLLGKEFDRLRLQLERGTAGFELVKNTGERSSSFAHTLEQGYELIRVITPKVEILISQPGIFRVDVTPEGNTRLIVREGEAFMEGQRIREKQIAVYSQGDIATSKFDPRAEDGFDLWCRERADKLVQANRSLKNDAPWVAARKSGSEPTVDLPGDNVRSGSPYVVSARPGAVNFVEPDVEISHAQDGWVAVTPDTAPAAGDRLRTSTHSHAELLLLPDIVLRLDGDSEIRFEELSYDAISFKLLRGAAILDAARFDRKQLPKITMAGPSTSVIIVDAGNYRIDVKSGAEQVTVRKGKVLLSGRSIGACKRVVNGTEMDCGKKASDNFDIWSDHRGEGELFEGGTRAAYLSRFRRQRFKSTGFWYQPPGLGYYTFVPFSLTDFESPYGGNYSSVLSPRRVPLFRPNWRPRVPD